MIERSVGCLRSTEKERDAETASSAMQADDYFGARYYSSSQGRFTSPDEFKGGIVDPVTGQDIETNTALPYADITDPQTLNKYTYVRNSPLRYVDPNGHDWKGRLEMAGDATLNVAAAAGKTTLLAGTAAATGPVAALAVAYGGLSVAGNVATAGVELTGAITGNTEQAEHAAKVVAATTTLLGLWKLLRTGSLDKAAQAAALEGVLTTNPKELIEGSKAARTVKTLDYAKTAKDALSTPRDTGDKKAKQRPDERARRLKENDCCH